MPSSLPLPLGPASGGGWREAPEAATFAYLFYVVLIVCVVSFVACYLFEAPEAATLVPLADGPETCVA